MTPEIAKMLSDKIKTPLHMALMKACEDKLKVSREAMQTHYVSWDRRHETYMRRRLPDKLDEEASHQGLPRKIIVPMSYSQINTFVAFGYMLYTQREKFYEFNPTEGKDHEMRECSEQLVHRDMLYSDYKKNLVMNLLNIARFGLGVEVDSWERDFAYVPVTRVVPPTDFEGQPTGEATVITKVTKLLKREGNCVRQISPYRVFPDPGFHITDWRRGSFFAWDDEFSREALLAMQEDGLVVGIEHVTKYDSGRITEAGRKNSRFAGINIKRPEESDVICITQMVWTLAPNSIKTTAGETLGPETMAHKWLIWIANDDRIVRAEPMINLHNQVPASLSFFAPDMHESTLYSLAYMLDDLQGLISWFMNSRMAAVSRTVDGRLVADPIGLNMDDVTKRHQIIRMTKGGSGKDVRRFLMPLDIKDSTQGHVNDMTNLVTMMQMVTGVNDNAMGQYNGGRRSATEARSVMNGAAARMKMVFDVMWGMAYQPQANRMLLNHRQQISEEEFVSVCGEEKRYYFQQFKGTPEQLIRSYDFVAYDGTLPSEKLFIAQQLQELLMILMSQPASAAAFGMDPVKVLKESMQLRGLGTGANFAFDQVPPGLAPVLQLLHGQPAQQPPSSNSGAGA